jgi:hypothetical protein
MATEEERREERIGLYKITSADSDGAGDRLRPLFTEVLEAEFSKVMRALGLSPVPQLCYAPSLVAFATTKKGALLAGLPFRQSIPHSAAREGAPEPEAQRGIEGRAPQGARQ